MASLNKKRFIKNTKITNYKTPKWIVRPAVAISACWFLTMLHFFSTFLSLWRGLRQTSHMTYLNNILKQGPLDTSNYYWNQLSEQSRVKQLLAAMASIFGTSPREHQKRPNCRDLSRSRVKTQLSSDAFCSECFFSLTFKWTLCCCCSMYIVHFTFIIAKIAYGSIFLSFYCFCVKHIELPMSMKRAIYSPFHTHSIQINLPCLTVSILQC